MTCPPYNFGRRVAAAFVAAFFLTAALSAEAQTFGPCVGRKELIDHLASTYGEHPVARGLASAGAVIEVVVSSRGDTWSIIVTLPNGLSCGLAAGEAWQTVPSAVRADPPA